MKMYLFFILPLTGFFGMQGLAQSPGSNQVAVREVFERVRSHDFHPLNDDNSMTMDRHLGVAGIANMKDSDWRVRLLAVRDLVRAGIPDVDLIKEGLTDKSVHVRHISAMALGILKADQAIEDLEYIVATDSNSMVRSQAVVALGQIGTKKSLDLLREILHEDPSRDVRHQVELSIDQIEKQMVATDRLLNAYLTLDESEFGSVGEGDPAPDFSLEDTEGKEWQLSRPATVIIDPQGIVRFAYTGTFWGDRPTIEQTLQMIETEEFSFEHHQRRKSK